MKAESIIRSTEYSPHPHWPSIQRYLELRHRKQVTDNSVLYHYASNNPVRYIDPDGRHIIILNRSYGAKGFGHNAILIGNDTDGWIYFSKNGDNPVNGTINPETGEIASSKDSLKKKDNINNNNEKLKFATLDDFISENKKRDKDDQYDRGLKIETLPEDDKKFIDQGETNYQKPYSLHENENGENCGDLVGNIVINAAVDGVHGNKDGIFGFTIPNWQYEKFSKENPNAIEIDVLRSSDER